MENMAHKIGIIDGPDLLHGLGGWITLIKTWQLLKVVIQLLYMPHELPDGNPVGFLDAITYVIHLRFNSIISRHSEHVERDALLEGVPRLVPLFTTPLKSFHGLELICLARILLQGCLASSKRKLE
jgi:hypothetical protein